MANASAAVGVPSAGRLESIPGRGWGLGVGGGGCPAPAGTPRQPPSWQQLGARPVSCHQATNQPSPHPPVHAVGRRVCPSGNVAGVTKEFAFVYHRGAADVRGAGVQLALQTGFAFRQGHRGGRAAPAPMHAQRGRKPTRQTRAPCAFSNLAAPGKAVVQHSRVSAHPPCQAGRRRSCRGCRRWHEKRRPWHQQLR